MSDPNPWTPPPEPPGSEGSRNPYFIALLAVLVVPVVALIGGLVLAAINDNDRNDDYVVEDNRSDDSVIDNYPYDDNQNDDKEADDKEDDELDSPPAPAQYGTAAEIGSRGDDGNPGALFFGAYPSQDSTQERLVGEPARFSGYTTWVHSIERVPTAGLVDGYTGDFVKLRVTIFNRDVEAQAAGAADFFVWSAADGRRNADFVAVPTMLGYETLASGATLEGDVYIYVGTAQNLFVVYAPDADELSGTATGVWRAP